MRVPVAVCLALTMSAPASAQLTKKQVRKLCRAEQRECLAARLPDAGRPVRARSATFTITRGGGFADVTVAARTDATVRVDIAVRLGSLSGDDLYVCYNSMTLLQGGRQLELCAVDEPNEICCRASPGICDDINEGITTGFTLSQFPAWFDLSAPFTFDWENARLDVP